MTWYDVFVAPKNPFGKTDWWAVQGRTLFNCWDSAWSTWWSTTLPRRNKDVSLLRKFPYDFLVMPANHTLCQPHKMANLVGRFAAYPCLDFLVLGRRRHLPTTRIQQWQAWCWCPSLPFEPERGQEKKNIERGRERATKGRREWTDSERARHDRTNILGASGGS